MGLSRILAFAVILTCATTASAFPYVVRKGDTVGQIAERMYGRIELERVLVAANGLDDVRASALAPGMRLEVPAVAHHHVEAGESWSSMAAEHLGGAERGDALARLNGDNPWVQPAVGREIVIPYNLRYIATQGDTTDSVAYRFLGKRDLGWIVMSYNGLKLPQLGQGQLLLVPLSELPLSDTGKSAARAADLAVKSEAGGKARETQDQAERATTKLERQLRHGEYVEAIVMGASLVARGELTTTQRARIHALLTEAYVAVGAKALASDACQEWREHAPELELDPLLYSPKILAACLSKGEGE
jgi:phage tail protein X